VEYVTITIQTAMRDDFVDEYGWDQLVANMGGDRPLMRDVYRAVEYATPKGKTTVVVRVTVKVVPLLRQMFEVRWADHFARMNELEGPYSRAVDQLKKIANDNRKK
jgi:hypothetical protein